MAEQSQFSKLPKKQLALIAEKLIDEDFPIGNPYDYDFSDAYNTLETIGKYFSISAVHEDVEFFSKFLEMNLAPIFFSHVFAIIAHSKSWPISGTNDSTRCDPT